MELHQHPTFVAARHVMDELFVLGLIPMGCVSLEYTREHMRSLIYVSLRTTFGFHSDIYVSRFVWCADNEPDDPDKWKAFARRLYEDFEAKRKAPKCPFQLGDARCGVDLAKHYDGIRCDKTKDDCETKFHNLERFGNLTDIPKGNTE